MGYLLPSTNGNGNGHEMKFVTYQVRTPSEKMKGSLTFSYRFGGTPIISGPAYQQVPASWASPSQHGYGPHCYMPQPPPPPHNEEIRLQKAGLVVSALSLFRE